MPMNETIGNFENYFPLRNSHVEISKKKIAVIRLRI